MEAVFDNLETVGVAKLVLAAQQGERDAFGELFGRFKDHVYAVAMARLRNHAEAEDLCQEVFVQAWFKLGQLRVPEAFAGWLRCIARRMAINRAVRRAPDVACEPEALEGRCLDERTPLDFVLAGEEAAQVQAGLDQLGALDRETLEAFYVGGQSLLEMSDEFDAPVGTIKRRLHVARKRLAKQVEPLVCC